MLGFPSILSCTGFRKLLSAPTPCPDIIWERCFLVLTIAQYKGLPSWLRWQSICLQCSRHGFDPWIRKIHWRWKWQPTPVFLPGESHGQRSLVGCSPKRCRIGLDCVTDPQHTHKHKGNLLEVGRSFLSETPPRRVCAVT